MQRELIRFRVWVKSVTPTEVIAEFDTIKNSNKCKCSFCKTSDTELFITDRFGDKLILCLGCIEHFINSIERKTYRQPKRMYINAKQRFEILMRDNFSCVYCGRNPKEDGVKLEVDHAYPKIKGGADAIDNLVTACLDCNRGKKDTILNHSDATK